MFNLDLEKVEEPETKFPTSIGSQNKQENSKKHLLLLHWLCKDFDCVDHNKLWKILNEMGTPDHLTCLLRNLYAGQEAIVRTGHRTMVWSQIGKGVCQGCILSPCLFNLLQSTSWEILGWIKHKLESRLQGEISIPQICKWHHPYGRKQRGTKQPLYQSERGEWKSWLKTQHSKNYDHGIWPHHFMANRQGNNGIGDRLYFCATQNHCRWWLHPLNQKTITTWKESYDQPR